MPVIYILLAVLAIPVLLLLIAVLRTRKMPHKTTDYALSNQEDRMAAYALKLSQMVQIETVSERGNPQIDKFYSFHRLLERLYPTVFTVCERTEIDGNLLLKWRGKSAKKPIMLMAHMDVVEATGTWKYPPFSGTIADGKVWGRGSGDTKCSLMCYLQAVEEMLQEGYVPECDVYLASSCTEEIGGDGAPKIAAYLQQQGVHLYMLCDEGGSIVQDPVGGVSGHFAAVGIFEKGYGDLRFIARSNGGHSSTPGKNTPIPRLAKFICRVERRNPFTAKFAPAVSAMFTSLAPYASGFGLRLVLGNLWLFRPLLCKLMPAISSQAAAMLRTTIAFTMQSGSAGYNVLPQTASVCANLRFIPHQANENSVRLITRLAARYGLETEVVAQTPPSAALNLEGDAFALVRQTIASVFPGVGIMPYVVTGGTDARFYGDVCDNCVRFSPVCYGPEQLKGMHGLDENIEIGTLPGAVDYYKAIVRGQAVR